MTDFLTYLRTHYAELGNFNIEFRLRQEDDWPTTLDYWFGSDKWRQSGHRFELIGVDSTGGLYCQWSYPDLGALDPPIVFLGSEGEGVGVVAASIADLVEILAQGYVWSCGEQAYVTRDEDLDPIAFPQFNARVSSALGRRFLRPEDLLANARQQHPSFKAWADAQVG